MKFNIPNDTEFNRFKTDIHSKRILHKHSLHTSHRTNISSF